MPKNRASGTTAAHISRATAIARQKRDERLKQKQKAAEDAREAVKAALGNYVSRRELVSSFVRENRKKHACLSALYKDIRDDIDKYAARGEVCMISQTHGWSFPSEFHGIWIRDLNPEVQVEIASACVDDISKRLRRDGYKVVFRQTFVSQKSKDEVLSAASGSYWEAFNAKVPMNPPHERLKNSYGFIRDRTIAAYIDW